MDCVIRFPYWLSSSLSTLLYVFFARSRSLCLSVKLVVCRKQKKGPIATAIASFMQQNLNATQISSRQKRDRCPIFLLQKLFFLPPALYTQYTSNWGKSFLFISPLYTPDKIWLTFCEKTVDLHLGGSILVHRHNVLRHSSGISSRTRELYLIHGGKFF